MNVQGERWQRGRGGGEAKLARVDCHLKILRVIDARKAAGDAGIEFTARDAEHRLGTLLFPCFPPCLPLGGNINVNFDA